MCCFCLDWVEQQEHSQAYRELTLPLVLPQSTDGKKLCTQPFAKCPWDSRDQRILLKLFAGFVSPLYHKQHSLHVQECGWGQPCRVSCPSSISQVVRIFFITWCQLLPHNGAWHPWWVKCLLAKDMTTMPGMEWDSNHQPFDYWTTCSTTVTATPYIYMCHHCVRTATVPNNTPPPMTPLWCDRQNITPDKVQYILFY